MVHPDPGSRSVAEGVALTQQSPANEPAELRVVQVIAPAPFGGAESVVTALAAGWQRRGGGGVVALMASPESDRFVVRARAADVPVWEVRAGTRAYATEVRCVREIVRREGASVLHAHGYRADAVGYLAARVCGVPVVSTVHGFTGGDWKNRAYEWFDRRLLRRFDAVACVSSALVTQMLAMGGRPERVRFVPNVPGRQAPLSRDAARDILGVPPGDRVVGWVGRLSPEKAPERFVAALGLLDRECVGVIVGDGPLRGSVAGLAAGAGNRVRLVGAIDEADRLLPAFDVLVLSSRTEGTPMVLLEAMRAQVPVVSFAVGGVPAVLEGAGWLVTPGDVAGLASAIAEALGTPHEAVRRAAVARARVDDDYGEARWLDAYGELYGLAAG